MSKTCKYCGGEIISCTDGTLECMGCATMIKSSACDNATDGHDWMDDK